MPKNPPRFNKGMRDILDLILISGGATWTVIVILNSRMWTETAIALFSKTSKQNVRDSTSDPVEKSKATVQQPSTQGLIYPHTPS